MPLKLFDPIFDVEQVPVTIESAQPMNTIVEHRTVEHTIVEHSGPGSFARGNLPSTPCKIRQGEGWVPALIDLKTRIVIPAK